MSYELLGDRALRFMRPVGIGARAIVEAAKTWPNVLDVVVTREEVALYFDGEPSLDPARIAELATLSSDDLAVREHVLQVVYDGPDLEDVARETHMTVEDVIAIHSAGIYTVDSMGFAPGFAYLDGLDLRLELPRRTTPRERVPARSVAIAGRQTAVYPFDSPGGWHIIGRVVGVQLFGERGALFALGDHVRFQP